jgi:hypothetical protein
MQRKLIIRMRVLKMGEENVNAGLYIDGKLIGTIKDYEITTTDIDDEVLNNFKKCIKFDHNKNIAITAEWNQNSKWLISINKYKKIKHMLTHAKTKRLQKKYFNKMMDWRLGE